MSFRAARRGIRSFVNAPSQRVGDCDEALSTKTGGVSAALCVSALTMAMSSAWAQGAAQTGAPDPASVPPTTGMTQIPPPPLYPLVPGGDAAAVATCARTGGCGHLSQRRLHLHSLRRRHRRRRHTRCRLTPSNRPRHGAAARCGVRVLSAEHRGCRSARTLRKWLRQVFLPTIGYRFTPSWMGIVRFGMVGKSSAADYRR